MKLSTQVNVIYLSAEFLSGFNLLSIVFQLNASLAIPTTDNFQTIRNIFHKCERFKIRLPRTITLNLNLLRSLYLRIMNMNTVIIRVFMLTKLE